MRTRDGGETQGVLRSIEHSEAKVSVHLRHDDFEVMVVEIGARGSLTEPALWDGPAWHFVIEGQAIFHEGNETHEVLPDESLSLTGATPYTIVNPRDGRLKLVSIIAGDGAKAEKEPAA